MILLVFAEVTYLALSNCIHAHNVIHQLVAWPSGYKNNNYFSVVYKNKRELDRCQCKGQWRWWAGVGVV